MCKPDQNVCKPDQNVCESDQNVCKSDKNVCESDKNTLFLGVTHHNAGPTHKRVLVAKEIQRKTENIRGFPKVDHSDIDARIVLEQINSAKKKTTSNGT